MVEEKLYCRYKEEHSQRLCLTSGRVQSGQDPEPYEERGRGRKMGERGTGYGSQEGKRLIKGKG